jgi:regulator of protease activity HflC (stomatin/prohibitin superfamily)
MAQIRGVLAEVYYFLMSVEKIAQLEVVIKQLENELLTVPKEERVAVRNQISATRNEITALINNKKEASGNLHEYKLIRSSYY